MSGGSAFKAGRTAAAPYWRPWRSQHYERPAFRRAGTYTLDDGAKTLTLRVDQSSASNWRGTTQTGKLNYLTSDYLGWTQSTPLVASADFASAELIWRRA
jgi:hypothetical protein